MLAPSNRQHTKRQRGISLSRNSSQQKFPHSLSRRLEPCLNQSFECHELASSNQWNQGNLGEESVLKEQNGNRVSVMGQKYKSSRGGQKNACSHRRIGSGLKTGKQKTISESSIMGYSLLQQAQSMHQMIQLLVGYEKQCQKEMDLESAEEARKRINELKAEEIKTRRKQLQVEGKEYVIKTRRQGQVEQRQFYEFWDHKVLQARQALKQIEEKHLEEQRRELAQYERGVNCEPDTAVKYSSKVLQTRRNLTSLIKSRKYKEAEHLKELLAKRQVEEQEKWAGQCVEKRGMKVRQFKKRQLMELEAFRVKLNSSFNELIKEKEKQEERMRKKMKKMEVEANKMPSAIVKAKKDLLNHSKANIENEDSRY